MAIQFFFLITLLAALSLAAPNPVVRVRGLEKRTFKVPRAVNRAHPRGPNGYDAMKKVALKYNMVNLKEGFIATSKSAETQDLKINAASGGSNNNKSGTVAANPGPNAALFLSPVSVGGQTLNLDFDSGSSDLWMFSTNLPADAIGQHAAFDASKSSTFKKVDGAQWSISYGDGSGAAGTVGLDTVTIGGVTVENQAVELASAVSKSFQQDTETDGLVGLAFSKLNTINDGKQRTPQKTFFDNVMKNLDQPVFTADLNPDGTGVYEFGKIDSTKFTGQMAWIPVNTTSGFWQFPSTKFAVDGKEMQNTAGSQAIADTGTSLLLVDQNVADSYYAKVQGAQNNAQVGGYIYPCNAKLPDMAVAIGDNYMAKIPGSKITFANVDKANTTCFGGVQGNQGSGLQIYGDVMFRAQFVAFNGGNSSLGFAPKPN